MQNNNNRRRILKAIESFGRVEDDNSQVVALNAAALIEIAEAIDRQTDVLNRTLSTIAQVLGELSDK